MESSADIMQDQIKTLFLEEWSKKLEDHKVFEVIDQERHVTKLNLDKILEILELTSAIDSKDAHCLLDFYDHNKASFGIFYKDLIKLMQEMSTTDYENIVNAYTTPAERIVKSLIAIKHKYLKEDPNFEREMIFAINNINERKIYNTVT